MIITLHNALNDSYTVKRDIKSLFL